MVCNWNCFNKKCFKGDRGTSLKGLDWNNDQLQF